MLKDYIIIYDFKLQFIFVHFSVNSFEYSTLLYFICLIILDTILIIITITIIYVTRTQPMSLQSLNTYIHVFSNTLNAVVYTLHFPSVMRE